MTDLFCDLGKITGDIKPVHGFNNSARQSGYGELLDAFTALNPPVIRLHDTGYPLCDSHYVDLHYIFPNPDADENDESSYDFTMTDCYISKLIEADMQVMFRFGTTIEHAPKKYHIYAPENADKWACICEHIVRHYNCGWADGYNFNIKYWEIWNEPDGLDPATEPYGPPNWIGTAEQYYELYEKTAKLIKKYHPEVMVGGYSSCYILGKNINGKWIPGDISYFTDFLTHVKNSGAPLDFFTWHGYLGKNGIGKIEKEFSLIKNTLLNFGFEKTLIMDSEWNININDIPDAVDFRTQYYINMRNEKGASHAAAALFEMQRLGVDCAMYYDAQLWCSYGALFHVPELEPTKTYYAFALFAEMYEQHNAAYTRCDIDGIYSLAAAGNKKILAIANTLDKDITLNLHITGTNCKKIRIYVCDKMHELCPVTEMQLSTDTKITVGAYSFIKITPFD